MNKVTTSKCHKQMVQITSITQLSCNTEQRPRAGPWELNNTGADTPSGFPCVSCHLVHMVTPGVSLWDGMKNVTINPTPKLLPLSLNLIRCDYFLILLYFSLRSPFASQIFSLWQLVEIKCSVLLHNDSDSVCACVCTSLLSPSSHVTSAPLACGDECIAQELCITGSYVAWERFAFHSF